jgi:tRNA(Ile)-lysidine synthase
MDLPERVLRTAQRHGMFTPGQTVLVAVSGGPDSVALLHILHDLRDRWPISLAAAHLDHGFRGAESAADADYVRGLCDGLQIPCALSYENVPEQKKRLHLSTQEAARRSRHAFLRRAAGEVGAERIALGHTRDDRCETVLLNILRGTGPDGLIGFPAIRLPLVRPLYDVSRADTESYCSLHGLKPRRDPSNLCVDYRRNRIRHELLPSLAQHYNPRVDEALLRLSDLAAGDAELLDALASETLSAVGAATAVSRIDLNTTGLNTRPMALRRRVLRLAIARLRGGLEGIDHETIDRILHAAGERRSAEWELVRYEKPPLTVRVGPDVVSITYRNEARNPTSMEWRVPLPAEGSVTLPSGAVLEVKTFDTIAQARAAYETAAAEIEASGGTASALLFQRSEIRFPLAARSWRAGDRMRPRGLGGTKKLQDIFVDRKIPINQRPNLPVIVECGRETGGAVPPPRASTDTDERILGILGLQGGESSLPTGPAGAEAENIGGCLLIMALSHTSLT